MSNETEIQHEYLHQFLSIALGGNSFLHSYIGDSYRKNEWEYYEAYQKSGMKGNPLFSMYTTKNEEKIRQAAGIVEWCYQNQNYSLLDQLIKKGYKFAYQYFQQHTQIDFDHFMRSFAKKQKGKMIKEIELIYQNIIIWHLCVRENKPIDKTNVAWQSFQKVLQTAINEIKLQKLMRSQTMFDKHRKEIDELYEAYHIPKNHVFDTLGFFLEYLISDKLKQIKETNPTNKEDDEQLVFQYSPVKYIGAIGGWLKTLKIHELDATEQIPFTKKDLEIVFLELLNAKKYKYINKDEQDLFFITCLYLKCLSSLFQETKKLYLDQGKQEYYLEIKAKESKIKEQEAELKRREQEWKISSVGQQKQIEGLTMELREAYSNIRQLEQQMEEMEDYSVEVHALRNYVYCEDQDDNGFEQFPEMTNMREFIQSKRIVIFGGSPNWRQKLNELLPTVEFVGVEEKNRDISKIQRADAVFINTAVFAHAFYKKIIKELSKSETPLFYLNGQSNIERTILEIYKWLTE